MKISIVTPSFNQVEYLSATLDSVLNQGYPELEYLVLDGGSTDGSQNLLKRYESRLDFCRSKKDGGQFAAIEEGFRRSHGEIMGWLNSDDQYFPWTLSVIAKAFREFPELEWVTSAFPVFLDRSGNAIYCSRRSGFNRRIFEWGGYLPSTGGCIQQESTFWRRSLWERAGGRLSTNLKLAADFELWSRFYSVGATLHAISTPLAGFRVHPEQKTAHRLEEYESEALAFVKGPRVGLSGQRLFHRLLKPGMAKVWKQSLPYSPKLSLKYSRRHEDKPWYIRR